MEPAANHLRNNVNVGNLAARRRTMQAVNTEPPRLRNIMTRPAVDRGRYPNIRAISMPINPNQRVYLHVPENEDKTYVLFATMLACISKETDICQVNAYYCSLLTCFFPDLVPIVRQVFAEAGVGVLVQQKASERAALGLTLEPACNATTALIYFAQAVLILYKNVRSENYLGFMGRSNAIVADSMISGEGGEEIAINVNKAMMIKGMMGRNYNMRKAVLERLLASSTGTSAPERVYQYLCNIISWTEMAGIVYIYDTLLITRSPVLQDPSIAGEVRNLNAAMQAVGESAYPQYFKILDHPSKGSLVERSKFPILLGVARALKKMETETVGHYAETLPETSRKVTILVDLHNRYIAGRRFRRDGILSYLLSAEHTEDNEDDSGEA